MNEILDIIFKIVLTIILSVLVGTEREIRQKGVDLRTYILVGLGSMLIVLTSIYLFNIYNSQTPVDPTRMIAGITTGIGFLCAGTIMQAQSHVRGLTTAATLWIVSCIGISVGAGHYNAAIAVSVVTFLVLIGMRSIEIKLSERFNKKDLS